MKKAILIGSILGILINTAVADVYCPANVTCKNNECTFNSGAWYVGRENNTPIKDGMYYLLHTSSASAATSCLYVTDPGDYAKPVILMSKMRLFPDTTASRWIHKDNWECPRYNIFNFAPALCPFKDPK